MRNILFPLFLFLLACSPTGRQDAYFEGNKQEIEEAIQKLPKKEILPTHIIQTKESAVLIAEAIAISVYGKENILKQRPYSVAEHKGYWIVSGNLPANMMGGVFTVILDAKTAEIVKLVHGK